MKVTSYYPIFYANDIESEVKRYQEDFGFEVMHHPKAEGLDLYVLGVGDGTRINLVHLDTTDANGAEDGFYGMRVNVDNFDEGVVYFEGQGYEKATSVIETESFKAMRLKKSNGHYVVVFYHKK